VLALHWRRPWFFVTVVVVDVVADVLSLILRQLTDRPRPFLVHPLPRPLVHPPSTGSFPSGHSTTAFACATVIAWADPRLAAPVFVLAALVAWSRVYVGVHYPLDVIGGAALGVLVAKALLTLLGARRQLRPGTRAG
jgi:undecaprenyl-diphosphatase